MWNLRVWCASGLVECSRKGEALAELLRPPSPFDTLRQKRRDRVSNRHSTALEAYTTDQDHRPHDILRARRTALRCKTQVFKFKEIFFKYSKVVKLVESMGFLFPSNRCWHGDTDGCQFYPGKQYRRGSRFEPS